jgi:hypothetical protein
VTDEGNLMDQAHDHEGHGNHMTVDLLAAVEQYGGMDWGFPLIIHVPAVCDTCGEVRSGLTLQFSNSEELAAAIAWEREKRLMENMSDEDWEAFQCACEAAA